MKKAKTIVKQLAILEGQLNCYSDNEIQQAIEEIEEKNPSLVGSVILSMIYEGLECWENN